MTVRGRRNFGREARNGIKSTEPRRESFWRARRGQGREEDGVGQGGKDMETKRANERQGTAAFRPTLEEFLTFRVTPPAHPETMSRRVALIWEVGQHAEEQRAGEAVIPPKGKEGGGIAGGGGGGEGGGGGRSEEPEAS